MTQNAQQTQEARNAPGRPVLVIGGTGKTGRRVVDRLRGQGVEARVASRSGETPFDWDDRGTWDAALEGAAAAYIVPLDLTPSRTPALVERAAAAGIGRLVLLSARGVDVPGYFGDSYDVTGPHLEGELAVRASGVPWTILRPGWFAQNFSEGVFLDGVISGELALPAGDGAAAFVDADDIADVAVAALTRPGHEGQVYELSGTRALTVDDALAEIAKVTGRRAAYVPVPDGEFRAGLVAQGMAPEEAVLWTDAMKPIRTSQEAPVVDGVRRALGREPRDFGEFVRRAADAGAWTG
ncbi:NAD(P)H-binding protein [Streptomyces sp. NPDC088252]|uniref:NAD(P)H-binding protein n=1 Tax=unclassified Streptomyces TaxID=2593676 RepID=UPI003414A0B5